MLVNGYLLAPLFLIVPLMVSAVLAADAFAGEKERRTMESLLHLPVRNVDPMVMLICGYQATSDSSIDLFDGLSTPIVERFEPGDELGSKLQARR